MKRCVFSIARLALIAHVCTAAIVIEAPKPEGHTRLYKAAIDVLMTCYADPSKTVGVVGDSDGSILKILRSNYTVPVVLADTKMKIHNSVTTLNIHRLEVFVIAASSPERFVALMTELANSIWWNHYAYFLVLNTTPETNYQCSNIDKYLYVAFEKFGVLNAQLTCLDPAMNVLIFDSNPFTPRAPEAWEFLRSYENTAAPFSVFKRVYRDGGQPCQALHFAKMRDIGGYPFYFSPLSRSRVLPDNNKGSVTYNLTKKSDNTVLNKSEELHIKAIRHIIENVVVGLNASGVEHPDFKNVSAGMYSNLMPLSGSSVEVDDSRSIPFCEATFVAMTQHTGHISQLNKILSVIDGTSRIGMCLVYLITFLFFKFFLRQAFMPAVLNLVRLTCNSGLPVLPQNLAPTIYLACLLMFVVTLQAIYTGNLASLLTTIIPYPQVNTKQDLVDLDYKIYTSFHSYFEEPIFEGRVVKLLSTQPCYPYVLRDPLAACILPWRQALKAVLAHKLHLSRYPIVRDYLRYRLTKNNPLGHRIDVILSTVIECGVGQSWYGLSTKMKWAEYVDDDEVKRNKDWKVMTLGELSFAFVILGVGLTCSSVCFVVETVIYRLRLRKQIAKRRIRVFT